MSDPVLVGRSSSHYTRVARIFALELGVAHQFRPVLDLTTLDTSAYAGNPALKIPVWVDERGPLFGAENVCRELASRSPDRARVVLRGDLADRLVANAEEMVLHAMSTEVWLVMAKLGGDDRAAPPKLRASLENALRYLDESVDGLVERLPPDRALSFVEAAIYCVVTHLPWRQVMDVGAYARLGAFASRFGERASAKRTEYRFDAA